MRREPQVTLTGERARHGEPLSWHTHESATSAQQTTELRDRAAGQGWEHEYTRIGDLTIVAGYCTDREWSALCLESGITLA